MPFRFEGEEDDTAVYSMMKKITGAGYVIDEAAFGQPSLIITYPNDGDIFKTGQRLNIRFTYLHRDTSKKTIIRIFSNNKQIDVVEENKDQYNWKLKEPGMFLLEVVVSDTGGKELLRSPKVDIIVQNGLKE